MKDLFPLASARANDMSKPPIGMHIPLVDITGGVMIFRDHSLSVGFTVTARPSGTMPDDIREELFRGLCVAIKNLPPDAHGQVVYGQEARPSDLRARLPRPKIDNGIIRKAIEQRDEGILAEIGKGRIRVTTADVYVNVPSVVSEKELARRIGELEKQVVMSAPSRFEGFLDTLDRKLVRPVESYINGMFSPLNGAVVASLEEYQATRAKLMAAADAVYKALLQAGLKPEPMDGNVVRQRWYRRWNPSKFEAGGNAAEVSSTRDVPVAELFANSDFMWDPQGRRVPHGMLYLDGYYHKVLTLRMPPEKMRFPHLEPLVLNAGLNRQECVVNFMPGDPIARKKNLLNEEKALEKNQDARLSSTKRAQISNELRELGSGEHRVWDVQHFFVLRAKTKEQLEGDCQALITTGQMEDSMELTEEVPALYQYWMASQPGWCRDKDHYRHNVHNTEQLASMLPICGGGRIGKGKVIGALFETTEDGLYNCYLHDNQELPNPNALILGKSGSGKSVLANTIFLQLMRHKPRLTIVDVGASYRRLCKIVGGDFREFDIRSSECRINPFDVFSGRVADNDEIQAVLLLLGKMVVDAKNPTLGRAEHSELEDALITLITKQRGKVFYLSDYKAQLAQKSSEIARDLALRMAPFVGAGNYAYLFDGPTKLPQGNHVTVFELARVNHSAPELLPVVFQAVLQHVVTMANNYPDDVKVLGLDEAHVLLKDPVLRKFVELVFRTFRKLSIAVVGISQAATDWVIDGNEMAILGNISAIYACTQVPASVNKIEELFELSPAEAAAFRNLEIIPGSHAEFAAMRLTSEGRRTSVCRNRLRPIENAMFTTDGEDTRVMNRWEAAGMSTDAAVLKFAEKYPAGVRMAGGPAPEDMPL